MADGSAATPPLTCALCRRPAWTLSRSDRCEDCRANVPRNVYSVDPWLSYSDDPAARAFVDEHPDGATLEECAIALGVTRENIRQQESKALARLVKRCRLAGISAEDVASYFASKGRGALELVDGGAGSYTSAQLTVVAEPTGGGMLESELGLRLVASLVEAERHVELLELAAPLHRRDVEELVRALPDGVRAPAHVDLALDDKTPRARPTHPLAAFAAEAALDPWECFAGSTPEPPIAPPPRPRAHIAPPITNEVPMASESA